MLHSGRAFRQAGLPVRDPDGEARVIMPWHRKLRYTSTALIVATAWSVASSGCDKGSESAHRPTGPSPSVPAPSPPTPPQPSGQVIRIGEPITGTIASDSDCKFRLGDPRFADLCEAFTVTAPGEGTLVVDVRAADGPLVLRFRTATGDVIDAFCCSNVTGRVPVRAGSPMEFEIAYVGRPPGYPMIPPIAFTLELSLVTGDIQKRGNLSAIVFGDTTKTQRLPNARLEVLDGPLAGMVARFSEISGSYELPDLPAGFIRVRVSAPAFDSLDEELVVGAQLPRKISLQRTVRLDDANRSLMGWVRERSSSVTGVKIEILDGPMAGVFTFTDDDMGIYVLRSLPTGVVHVRASYHGLTQTQSVELSASTTALDFSLGQQ